MSDRERRVIRTRKGAVPADTARPAASALPLVSLAGLIDNIDESEWSIWRYRSVLPVDPRSSAWRRITLGEGATPLVDAGREHAGLKLKVDYAMPTLSFKDRGAVVMIAKASESGIDHVAADSSGNAGTSIAAYAARAGMRCDIFVPASASGAKIAQIEMHGARVHRIEGPRQAATDAVQAFVDGSDIFYASHVLNPYFHEGTKTFAFEVWEQLSFRAPDHLVLPVGHGTLVLGAYKGFRELHDAGYIDAIPRIHAVQAAACAPIARAYRRNEDAVQGIESEGTIAEGIAITEPPRGSEILTAVRATGGTISVVSDDDIRRAKQELAALGFFVEPTAAATFAAFRTSLRGRVAPGDSCVVPLCGAGLKSPY